MVEPNCVLNDFRRESVTPVQRFSSFHPAVVAQPQLICQYPREGYWHFEVSHQLVLERDYPCASCHSAALPFSGVTDRSARLLQSDVCTASH